MKRIKNDTYLPVLKVLLLQKVPQVIMTKKKKDRRKCCLCFAAVYVLHLIGVDPFAQFYYWQL